MKGILMDWNEVKDKPFKILLSNLEQCVILMRTLGADIEEVDGQYWLKVNSDKGVDKVNENNNCMG